MRPLLLGALFFCGLLVLVYYTIFLSSFSFGGRVTLNVRFPNANFLSPGDKVLVAGTRIGRVSEVEYDEEGVAEGFPVRAALELEDDLKLYDDVLVRIESSTLLGGRLVTILPGRNGSPRLASEIGVLDGEVQSDVVDSLENVIAENREALRRSMENIAQASADLAKILRSLEEGRGSAGRLLQDEALHDEALALLKDARAILGRIQSPDSSLGRLLADDALYQEIEGIAKSLREIVEGAARGEGSLGLFLRDEALRERLDRIVARLDDATAAISAQEGPVGAFIYDGGMKASMQALMKNFETISAEIASGRSLAGEILVGRRFITTIAEPLEQSLADIRDLLQNVREGRGIAGMLLSDTESAALLRSILRNFGRSLEDAREAAPIATLIGVLVGIF